MKTILTVLCWISIVSSVNAQLGPNLLDNPGAESGFDFWACPNSDWGLGNSHTGSYGWAAGPILCTMYQTVDLIAKGYTAEILDTSPSIVPRVYVYPGWASGSSKGTITIKVELLNGSDGVISTTYISNNEVLPLSMTDWTEKSTTVSGYSSGMRKIKFILIGQDALGWAGHYGPVFDDANIQIDGPVPVELTTFSATAGRSTVTLAWQTATEINNYGFEIERLSLSDRYIAWSKVGFVEGNGTTNTPTSYSFVDKNAKGTVSYRLKQIDRDGKFEYHGAVEVTVAEPAVFALDQNYPNPFNPTTAISFYVPATGKVTLQVFDMLGKEVATLINGEVAMGAHSVQFNAAQLPRQNAVGQASGIYFYTLRTGNFNATRKMLLVK